MKYLALEKIELSREEFIELCNNNDIVDVLRITNLHRNTFSKYAKSLGCYNTNQGGGNKSKNIPPQKWDLDLWGSDSFMDIGRGTIKRWVLRLNLLEKKCNKCGLSEWLGQEIPLELNHINGKGGDHRRTNLELICPNCHSFTDSYRGKNNKSLLEFKERKKINDKKYREKNKIKKQLYDIKYREACVEK